MGATDPLVTDKPHKSDWETLAAKESRGKDLSRETVEGIRLDTVYGPEDATGIAENDPIVFWGVDAPPAPLQNGTVYYALNVANGSFQLAEEPAGAAIDITEGSPFSPDMWLAKLEPVTFALPGTLDVQGLSFDGTGV